METLNWQARATRFAVDHNLTHSASVYALDMVSELGEVAKELLLATDYGRQEAQFGDRLAGELGDVLYSLCLLATAVDVDLDAALTAALEKYTQRFQEKGHSGSGR